MVRRAFLHVAATTAAIVSLPTLCLASLASGSRSQSSWNPPEETVISSSSTINQPEAPVPTEGAIDFGGFPLRARYHDDSQTCGYDPHDDYALYCAWGSCVASGDFWGCCTTWYSYETSCTTFMITTCIEVDASYFYTNSMTETADYSDLYSATTCYPYVYSHTDGATTYSDMAFCATYISTTSGQTFSSYTCSSIKTAITMLDGPEYFTSITSDKYGYTTAYTYSSSRTSTSSTGSADSASQTISAGDLAKEQPRMIGAIVGGVIGGIILVGVGTFGVVHFWLKMFPDNGSSEAPSTVSADAPGATEAGGPLESTEVGPGSQVAVPQPAHTGGSNNAPGPSRPMQS